MAITIGSVIETALLATLYITPLRVGGRGGDRGDDRLFDLASRATPDRRLRCSTYARLADGRREHSNSGDGAEGDDGGHAFLACAVGEPRCAYGAASDVLIALPGSHGRAFNTMSLTSMSIAPAPVDLDSEQAIVTPEGTYFVGIYGGDLQVNRGAEVLGSIPKFSDHTLNNAAFVRTRRRHFAHSGHGGVDPARE